MANQNMFTYNGFPRVPLKNGIGRYVCQLQRLTIKFCKTSGDCKGVRNFIEERLLDFTRANPEVAIYLKPRRHHSPHVISEYLNGERHYQNFHNFTKEEVEKYLILMRTRSGLRPMRYRKLWHTDCPSIQGVWNPFVNADPKLNLMIFPSKEFEAPTYAPKTATEELLEMYYRQLQNEKLEEETPEDIVVQN